MAGVGGIPGGELHRDFHSTPDLALASARALAQVGRPHRSQEELRPPLPPPTHPPPPPPGTGQIVKVELNNDPDYSSTKSETTNGKNVYSIMYYFSVCVDLKKGTFQVCIC